MRSRVVVVLWAAAALAVAADPAGVVQWRAAELKAKAKQLAPKMDAKKVAGITLAKFDNHMAMLTHREASGEAELHESQADLFVVQSGEATLALGGEIVGGKSGGPGEIRGTSIKNGVLKKLGPGDIVHIPAKTPHQVLMDAGKQFDYFILKVDAR